MLYLADGTEVFAPVSAPSSSSVHGRRDECSCEFSFLIGYVLNFLLQTRGCSSYSGPMSEVYLEYSSLSSWT
jgi:hypothetical protein